MDISNILDQIDEIVYISDLESNELLFLNRYGRNRFGDPKPGTKCYAHLQNRAVPCSFCTNELLPRCPGQRHTWVRQYPQSGRMLLHDSIIEYEGRKCRMELAIDVNHCASDLNAAQKDSAAEKKLVDCVEKLVMASDFDVAVNSVLETIIDHYAADRAYIFAIDWEDEITTNTHEICKKGVAPEKDLLQAVPLETIAVWIDLFKQKRQINVIRDVEALRTDPARQKEYECLKHQNVQSLITVPLYCDGGLYGFLGVDNPSANVDAPELLTHITYVAANELQKQRLTEQLREKSYHDPLTGLQNRLAYEEKLLALQNGSERPIGVGFVDINGLKYLNDTLGHDYGNKALLRACDVMKTYFEPETLYRVSGDEFIILWTDVGFQSFRETCDLMAQELHGAQEELASFGRTWGTAGEELPKLIREAEQRMYDEKRKHHLQNEQHPAAVRPQYLDALLQEFRDSTFQLYLQPLYSIEQGRVSAAEGLVRKIDPLGRMHAPIEFIHMMEQERMISMVDYEMLRQACGLLVKWKAAWPEFRIGCNMSRITLAEPDYLNTVDKILAETGADPKRLTFEITEGSQGIQLESMGSLLDALRAGHHAGAGRYGNRSRVSRDAVSAADQGGED